MENTMFTKFEDYTNMFDVTKMAENMEKAQKQFFETAETVVKAQTKFMTDGIAASKAAVDNMNGQIAKTVKK